MLTFRMDFKNVKLLKQAMRKEQDLQPCLKVRVSMPQVRVSVVGRVVQLVGNHMHFRGIVHVTYI